MAKAKEKQYEGMTSKDRTKLLEGKLAELMKNIIRSPEQLKKYANQWRTGFHSYSFRNNLLILIQNPKASMVAGRGAWLAKHKRTIKENDFYKAQWILAPAFKKVQVQIIERDAHGKPIVDEETGKFKKVFTERDKLMFFATVPVYDVAQTEGPDLDIGLNSSKFKGAEFKVNTMAKCFPKYDIQIVEARTDGKALHDSNKIQVAKRKNKAQEVASLFHEIAHHELGHTDTKKRQARFKDIKPREVKQIVELEAQATAYLVCACVGIDELEGSADYIADWKGNAESIGRSAEKVMSTADRMLKQIAKTSEK